MLTTHQLQVEREERVIEPIKCTLSPHTSYRWRGERIIEPIKCMRSPHTSYRWRGESHWANQVYALTTHQLQVTHTDCRVSTPCWPHLHLYQQQPSFPRRSPIQVLTSSNLLSFSGQPVLGCRVIWLLATHLC